MKNKILISLVACFIAAGSFLHFNLAQNNNNSDISLADISVMAQADGESGGGSCNAGGPGAIQCNISTTVLGVSYSCEVTCGDGYYACCNLVAGIPPVVCNCTAY